MFQIRLSLPSHFICFRLSCRECEGCSGEEGEAAAEEESQTGDQRRQDGEPSLGESPPAAIKLLFVFVLYLCAIIVLCTGFASDTILLL